MRITIYINRSDGILPVPEKPVYQRFDIDTDPEETVAGALQHIYQNLDPTLAFRFVCNMQKCGECAVSVNKTPCLACDKRVEPQMHIDPLPNLPVVKDLVIDRHRVITSVVANSLLFKDLFARPASRRILADVPEHILKTGKCIECLMCQSVCPVLAEKETFPGPLGILWLTEMMTDEDIDRSAVEKEAERILSMCSFCGRCWKACPDGMNILGEIFKRFKGYKRKRQSGKNLHEKGDE